MVNAWSRQAGQGRENGSHTCCTVLHDPTLPRAPMMQTALTQVKPVAHHRPVHIHPGRQGHPGGPQQVQVLHCLAAGGAWGRA